MQILDSIFPYLLALHIIFIVTWFSALFYLVRLFIYHREALEKEEPARSILHAQLGLMESRLMRIIAMPSMILVLLSGTSLILAQPVFLSQEWLHVKLLFVALLLVYHFRCGFIRRELAAGHMKFSSRYLRMYNELATLMLVAIVFLAVVKDLLSLVWGLGALLLLMAVFMFAIRVYAGRRNNKKTE